MADFKSGKGRVLVATDIAARGLDINQLPYVVNFELPKVPEDYVHRIGRTGRAGHEGEALSLVCVDEMKFLKDIEGLLKRAIPKVVIDDFEPDPSINPESVTKGRGKQQHAARKPAGKKTASTWNSRRSPFKGGSNNPRHSGRRPPKVSKRAP